MLAHADQGPMIYLVTELGQEKMKKLKILSISVSHMKLEMKVLEEIDLENTEAADPQI